ncbi:MAG: hypothetical protein JJE48_00150 [Actinobacteria bacterium]|nr:hypothetical protein [Actinomycetota bacterium]
MQSGEGGLGMAIGSEEPWLGGDFVICRLTAEDGTFGLGEAMLWLPETGASPEQIISIIRDCLYRYVIGENPFDIERINRRMDINLTRNEVAKGLLDIACYDLMGRASGRPAYDFMGGRQVKQLQLAALIPLMEADAMVWLIEFFYEDGWRTFRLKLGRGIEEDVTIVKKTRDALGDEVRLRVDYNQAYSPEEAVRAIKAIEPYGIDFAEQPVEATDFVSMAKVQKQVEVPLMAHEGCFSLHDIMTLVELGSIGVVGINSERPGGITKALRAIDFAEERGLGTVLHSQTLGIASAAQLNIVAARHDSFPYETELFGHVMLEDDLITEPIDYSHGTATLPEGPGWGVELDEEALEKYATGPTVVITEG